MSTPASQAPSVLPTAGVVAVLGEYGNVVESAVELLKQAEVDNKRLTGEVEQLTAKLAKIGQNEKTGASAEDIVLQKIASASRADIDELLARIKAAGYLQDHDMDKLAAQLQTDPGGIAKLASSVLSQAINPAHSGGHGIAKQAPGTEDLTAHNNGHSTSTGTRYRLKSAAEEAAAQARELEKEQQLWKQAAVSPV